MGQRANLVIVKQDSYDLYFNHWCANTLKFKGTYLVSLLCSKIF